MRILRRDTDDTVRIIKMITNEIPEIPVVAGRVNRNEIKVNCPYCGQVHRHGYTAKAYPAHRVSHCHLKKAASGYMVIVA